MAVTQISRIQHRRGLEQDLPQLASAELGWSVDTQKLYIGNGTLEEGAPATGVTEILTTNSITNIPSLLGTYSFVGDVAGYPAQTGTSTINPTVRSYQQKLDDIVNIKDFGAKGNGVDDDTDSINRALQQIYKIGINDTDPRTRRTIYFPGGTYLISSPLKIPRYATLVGDGSSSTIIKINSAIVPMVQFCDTLFQTGTSLGSSSAELPAIIEIHRMQFINIGTNIIQPLVILDSASDINFSHVTFVSNVTAGYYPNVINITSNVDSSRRITLDSCGIIGGGNGLVVTGTASVLNVYNSVFDTLTNTAVVLNNCDGFSSINNYYGNVTTVISKSDLNDAISIGDYYYTQTGNITSVPSSSLHLGKRKITYSAIASLSSSPTVIPITGNIGATLNYDISNTSSKRYGSLTFAISSGTATFSDDYVENGTSFKANIFITPTSLICSINSGTANMKYNYEVFE